MVKVEKGLNLIFIYKVYDQKPFWSISSKVGLIASIFSKVSSILWAQETQSHLCIVANNNIADTMIVKIEYEADADNCGVFMAI